MGNSQTARLRPEVMMDLTLCTNFNESEIRQWYRNFCEDYPDGTLSIDQFKDAYVQHFPNGDATKFAEHVFRTFDTYCDDGNHLLDFREFMMALSITARGGPKDRLEWAFEMYDIDENEYITIKECTEIINAIYRLRGGALACATDELTAEQRAQHIMQTMDKDNDGCISMEEFIDGARMDQYLVEILQKDQVREQSRY